MTMPSTGHPTDASGIAAHNPVLSGDFGPAEREADLRELSHTLYDLCIIGGGITGAAIARDAALRGLKVLLVEKSDFASGTSSRSSKLVHGGVRYLEQYEFKLVFEATRERARLWQLAPHLVTPMPFVFPTFRSSRVPLWKLNVGLWLYDLLSLFRSPTIHKKWDKAETLAHEPGLRSEDLVGSIFYWDGATDDALLTLSNVLDARSAGAAAISRLRLDRIDWNDRVAHDPQAGHELHLRETTRTGARDFRARARAVISATGPWTDQLLRAAGQQSRTLLAPTRGSHIVVPFDRLPSKNAVVIFHPKDGRVLFTIPWSRFTVIGTTDVFDKDDPDHVHVTQEETQYLIDAANSYFPAACVQREDILSTWSGLRPLLAPPTDASASQVSREHHIEWFEPGLLVIAGGKLTTHREMAEQAVEAVLRHTRAWTRPLPGRRDPSDTRTRPLPRTLYPRADGAPIGVTEAGHITLHDIEGLCRTQMVLCLEDLLVRRTQLFYKEPHNGWTLLPKIKDAVCRTLGWSEADWRAEVATYRVYLEQNVLKPLGKTLPEISL